jgi:hypothetical protein
MADAKTERSRAITTDLDGMRKEWFDVGFKAGAESECARIRGVEEQGSGFPGHEDLVAKLKYDGKTTGPQAAVQIIAAEKKKLGAIAADLRSDAGSPTVNSPTEDTTRTGVQQVDGSMSQEQVMAIAKREWGQNPKLHREFSGEEQYCAFRKAEAAGRVRVLDKPRKVN